MAKISSKTCSVLNTVCMTMFIVYIGSSTVLISGVKGTLYEECSKEIDKVSTCLSYATGKATTPGKECCDAVKDMKESDPKCLCFVIQQSSNASATTVSMGIQVDKLLRLPSVCQLKNASISNCPKLLGIPANSPDAAIFSNATTTPATSTTTTGTGQTLPDNGFHQPMRGPTIAGSLFIAFAIFLSAFPASLHLLLQQG